MIPDAPAGEEITWFISKLTRPDPPPSVVYSGGIVYSSSFLLFCVDNVTILWTTDTLCFGLKLTPPMSFKARLHAMSLVCKGSSKSTLAWPGPEPQISRTTSGRAIHSATPAGW